MADSSSPLQQLPRVDRVLGHPLVATATRSLGLRWAADVVRRVVAEERASLRSGARANAPSEEEIATEVARRAHAAMAGRAQRVINATGILLHTNLGRAPLSVAASAAVAEAAAGYSSIELDLATGRRGKRAGFLEASLATLAGAEAALVVNNCAAAVLLLLAAVARGRSVIVSRGELIEIGGGFRVPDVMLESGAKLVEVGTTNKTRVADYTRALDQHPDAVGILRVHQGNFRQLGFVDRPSLEDLSALARERNVLLLKDLGGGAVVDLAQVGFVGEPLVDACVRCCDAVTFSTDKAFGGPQGGVIAGRSAILDKVRAHPLARALRVGRLAVAALEATSDAYLEGRGWLEVPTLRMASVSATDLAAQVEGWCAALVSAGVPVEKVRRVASEAEMGGGTLATRTVPSSALCLVSSGADSTEIARRLRMCRPPILARVVEEGVLLDARTVLPAEVPALLAGVREVLA